MDTWIVIAVIGVVWMLWVLVFAQHVQLREDICSLNETINQQGSLNHGIRRNERR